MATNNSGNNRFTNNSDGFDLAGGTTVRKLTVSGADISVVGSGTNVYTFPTSTSTLASLSLAETLSNKTLTSVVSIGILQSTATSLLHINKNQNSVTQADANGILLANSTAATVGLQSISPPLVWQGNGWKTTATAGSQDVRFRADVLPVQGTTSPTATWRLASSINAGAYTTQMSVDSTGLLYTTTGLWGGSSAGTITSLVTALSIGGNQSSAVYKTTSVGANVNAMVVFKGATSAVASAPALMYDSLGKLIFTQTNTTNKYNIVRASLQLSNTSDTDTNEQGDLSIYTMYAGVLSERFRIGTSTTASVNTHYYNASNYYTTSVNISGQVNFDVVTSGVPYFKFNNKLGSSTQLLAGTDAFNSSVYRLNNGGGNATPSVMFKGSSGTGSSAFIFNSTNGDGIGITMTNSASTNILRASMYVTNATHTVSAETGDLSFSLINAGSPAVERFRLTSTGSRLVYDASNWFTTTINSNGGITFDAVGTLPGFTFNDAVTLADGVSLSTGTSTGTKIGTLTSQKIAFWNKTPIVQPTTAIASSTFVSGVGAPLTDTDTFGGYTLKQVVQALINVGLLA
jgi:hypothetical protein